MTLLYILPTILGMFISWIGYSICMHIQYIQGIMILTTYILLLVIGNGIWHTDSIGRRIAFFIILFILTTWPFIHRWRADVSIILSIVSVITCVCLSIVMIPKNKTVSLLLIPLAMYSMYLVTIDWKANKV